MPWSAEDELDGQKWTSLLVPELLTMASRRKDWKRISAESSPRIHPTTHSAKGLN